MFSKTDQWCGIHHNGDRFTAKLTCELAKSDSPNRDIYFQVLLPLGLSVIEIKAFDKKQWLHIHSGMCQAEEASHYGGLAK